MKPSWPYVKAACRLIHQDVSKRVGPEHEATLSVREEGGKFHVSLSVRPKGDPLLVASELYLGAFPNRGGLDEVVACLGSFDKRLNKELIIRVRQELEKGG